MLGYYPNSNAKPDSNLDLYETNKEINFVKIKVCTNTYVHRHKHMCTLMHIHIFIQYTYKTSIHNMAKQNLHGNIHAYTYIHIY